MAHSVVKPQAEREGSLIYWCVLSLYTFVTESSYLLKYCDAILSFKSYHT